MKLKKSIVAMALVASMICGSTMNLWAAEMTVKIQLSSTKKLRM